MSFQICRTDFFLFLKDDSFPYNKSEIRWGLQQNDQKKIPLKYNVVHKIILYSMLSFSELFDFLELDSPKRLSSHGKE